MNKNLLIVYALCGILAATGIVYFLVAYGEYTDWVELLNFGIHDETTEKQVEITLFITIRFNLFRSCFMVDKNKVYEKIAIHCSYSCFNSFNLNVCRFKNSGCANCGCRIICWKTRRDFKNYANFGDCTIHCGNV